MFHNPEDRDSDRSISLSRDDVRLVRRLLRRLAGPEESQTLHFESVKCADITRDALIARARQDLADRRRRSSLFGSSMFGEAAWDMLLALYVLEKSERRQTIGTLMHHAGVPTTTAKRWLDFLEARGMVVRMPHPTDRRTAFVSLTQQARSKLDLHYSETADTVV